MREMNVTLGRFNDSMNFAFGLTRGEVLDSSQFDIFNNPYIRLAGVEWQNGDRFDYNYDFEICPREHLEKFVPETMIEGYAQPLCFKSDTRDKVGVSGNWLDRFYNIPSIGLFYCENTEENG
jgi:hypothetical protein